jgi:hypothetical protein
MRKSFGLAICLLVAPAAFAWGWGSWSTTTTTSAPANQASQTLGQSTSSKEAQPTTKTGKPTAAETKAAEVKAAQAKAAEAEQKAPESGTEAGKPTTGASERQVPLSHRFPKYIQSNFIINCTAARGSASSCECVVVKLEQSNVEKGRSIAELLVLELALRRGASLEEALRQPLPEKVQRDVKECTSASKK